MGAIVVKIKTQPININGEAKKYQQGLMVLRDVTLVPNQ